MPTPPSPDALRAAFVEHGQEQVFDAWDTLDAAGRERLAADLALVDFAWLKDRLEQIAPDAPAHAGFPDASRLAPPDVLRAPATDEQRAAQRRAVEAGEDALRDGRVAAFLVAGGQGTRLGFDGPKGMFPVGPVSSRTLFHWHAEQIRARGRRYGRSIPWYIMTSRANDAATRAFFAQERYFGLSPEDVFFFPQAMVPAVDHHGRLLLAQADALALSPDGHGGALSALVRSGAVEDMRRRGVDTISYFQVDNPLVGIADPEFIGYHRQAGAEMSSRVLRKADAEEKLGNLVLHDGRLTVIEYSDFPSSLAHATNPDGTLRFWVGSIAIHMVSVDFVARVGGQAQLPWHVAHKKIAYYEKGRIVKPAEPNGVKFETFVFDALPMARTSVTQEIRREDEFGPIKNAEGVDSAVSSRQLLSNRAARWLRRAGATVPGPVDGDSPVPLEIAPLFALDAEELARKVPSGLTVENGLALL